MVTPPKPPKFIDLSGIYDSFVNNESALKRYLRRFFYRDEDIDDMTQETFLKASNTPPNARLISPKPISSRWPSRWPCANCRENPSRWPAKAAKDGGADAVSLINTINSIMRVDYDNLTMFPTTDGMGTHGGYCGEAVKPIALNMVAEIARTAETSDIPISGIGGITNWRDAVDFLALGAQNVQVCTAAMVYGFKIIDDLTDGLSNFLDDKGMTSVSDLVGKAVPSVTDWQYLNLNHIEKAVIDQDLCIKCGRCHIVCEDTSHQAITNTVNGERKFEVINEECVGCNLCVSVCPVDNCISMQQLTAGTDPRTGAAISKDKANWTTHPNNPMRKQG